MAKPSGTRVAGWMLLAGGIPSTIGVTLAAVAASPLSPRLGIAAGRSMLANDIMLAVGILLVALGSLVWMPGLALYVLVPSFSGRERARRDYGSHRVVLACTLLAAVVGNILAAIYFLPAALLAPLSGSGSAGSELAGNLLSPVSIAVSAASLDVALLAVVYLRIVRPGAVTWDAMGLSLRHLRGKLVMGLLFGLLLFVVSSILELLLTQIGVEQTQNVMFRSVTRASLGEFGLVLLAGALIAPIVEEIFFRGYVFRAYLDQKGPWRAFLFSSGLFAVVHLNLPALLPILAMGLLLSLLYYRTGSIVPGIVAHALNNAAAFTLLYLGLA